MTHEITTTKMAQTAARSARDRRRLLALAGAALAMSSLMQGAALAQDYPNKPIKIIVPYGAGGSVDAVARTLAQELTGRMGQPVVVENRVGAGSNIGSNFVAKAPPDGYTLLLASPANAVNVTLYKTMPYNVRTELAPVSLVGRAPGILLVNLNSPINSVKDLVDAAKKNPGKMSFGSGGAGSSEHLGGEMFKANAGIDLLHVPYKGGAAVVTDIMGGQIDAFFTNQANVIGQILGKQIKVLATAADKRSTLLPNVPTFAEAGYPEQKVSVWWGIMAPGGTPPAILDRLNREIVAAGNSTTMRDRLTAMGAEPLSGTRQQFGEFLEQEIARWGNAIRKANIKTE
ncbi:MAG: tripartite tricarboxylate transporter substrate binding protein [Burkholderiaceae bacterium]|nr:tripartite tricarboxylate transporter substrate binding protein [Burkholderiaceae bacterium]MDP1968803.1 tripartite tricarboxylate transporter substrate binding protein [Burkholderiaceae bacterium]